MTTSTEAAQLIKDHLEHALLDELGPTVVSRVELLTPTPGLTDLGANAALVVHLTTGERFGMEVCPFPTLPGARSGSLRTMTTAAKPQDEKPTPPDLSKLSKKDLEDLEQQVTQERRSRECQEFLPGHQSCDVGSEPHEEHGYTTWRNQDRIRVTWKTIALEGS